MKIASLILMLRGTKVLLGEKYAKAEIGAKTLNAPGGKCEENESSLDCAIREAFEEVGVKLFPEHLKKVAVITFHAGGIPDFEVHTYHTSVFEGEPTSTSEMVPQWFETTNLPLERMLESDRTWFPKVLAGERFRANVYYRERAKGFEHIEFLPADF